MHTLFISDLHLAPERPAQLQQFVDFTARTAAGADALYVLGDLFEYWLGDDELDVPFPRSVADALSAVAASGTALHFMRGNRDVLAGNQFAERCGARLIDDPTMVDLHGVRTLLMHGDTLCTDDVAYQAFRAQTRHPQWKAQFLAQPLPARLAFAQRARAASKAHQSGLQDKGTMETITDVAPATVEGTLARFGIDTLIHGHTHRPAVHALEVEGRGCQRIVLGDWYEQGSVLRVDAHGQRLESLT